MIQSLIIDVDGVIVGEKDGYNFPYPHPDVIARLKAIRAKGIFVSLCTAKPYYSVQKIIEDAHLDNLHITEGGGVIIDSLDHVILKKHTIPTPQSLQTIDLCLKHGIYTELYALDQYYVLRGQIKPLTQVHASILQRDPVIVDSLHAVAKEQEIVKIMAIATDTTSDKDRITALFKPYADELTLSWGVHPVALPNIFGIVTTKGISKQQGTIEISQSEGVSPDHMLGIGDSTSDWQFIESCRYAGAMGNATADLKSLVQTKGEGNFVIGKSVDENGILGILDWFGV